VEWGPKPVAAAAEGPTAEVLGVARASSELRLLAEEVSADDFDLGAAIPGSNPVGRVPMETDLFSGAGGTGGGARRLTPGSAGAAFTGGAPAPEGPTFSVSSICVNPMLDGAAFILCGRGATRTRFGSKTSPKDTGAPTVGVAAALLAALSVLSLPATRPNSWSGVIGVIGHLAGSAGKSAVLAGAGLPAVDAADVGWSRSKGGLSPGGVGKMSASGGVQG
jgi:hypothetical protein